jgi:hypothetical protein
MSEHICRAQGASARRASARRPPIARPPRTIARPPPARRALFCDLEQPAGVRSLLQAARVHKATRLATSSHAYASTHLAKWSVQLTSPESRLPRQRRTGVPRPPGSSSGRQGAGARVSSRRAPEACSELLFSASLGLCCRPNERKDLKTCSGPPGSEEYWVLGPGSIGQRSDVWLSGSRLVGHDIRQCH